MDKQYLLAPHEYSGYEDIFLRKFELLPSFVSVMKELLHITDNPYRVMHWRISIVNNSIQPLDLVYGHIVQAARTNTL